MAINSDAETETNGEANYHSETDSETKSKINSETESATKLFHRPARHF